MGYDFGEDAFSKKIKIGYCPICGKKIVDKTYFDPQYNDYPILTIWENGYSIEKIECGNVLKKIAEEINKL